MYTYRMYTFYRTAVVGTCVTSVVYIGDCTIKRYKSDCGLCTCAVIDMIEHMNIIPPPPSSWCLNLIQTYPSNCR